MVFISHPNKSVLLNMNLPSWSKLFLQRHYENDNKVLLWMITNTVISISMIIQAVMNTKRQHYLHLNIDLEMTGMVYCSHGFVILHMFFILPVMYFNVNFYNKVIKLSGPYQKQPVAWSHQPGWPIVLFQEQIALSMRLPGASAAM